MDKEDVIYAYYNLYDIYIYIIHIFIYNRKLLSHKKMK